MNKKATHVEIILSFVIFVMFLIFVIFISTPVIKTEKNKDLALEILESNLIEKISKNMKVVTVFNNSATESCLVIDITSLGFDVSELDFTVKSEAGNNIKSNYSSGFLKIETTENLSKIYYANETFNDYTYNPGVNPCAPSEVSLIRTYDFVFETEMINLISEYNSNYINLRDELDVLPRHDFSFNFMYNNGILIGPNQKRVTKSVYVKDIPIQYIDKNANINFGVINLKIW